MHNLKDREINRSDKIKLIIVAVLFLIGSSIPDVEAANNCYKEKRFAKVETGMTFEQVADTMKCVPMLALKGLDGQVIEAHLLQGFLSMDTYTGDNYIMVSYQKVKAKKWSTGHKVIKSTIIFSATGAVIKTYTDA